MIRFISHAHIDFVKWDGCVRSSLSYSMYGLSWFLNAAHQGWNAVVLNDYEAVLVIPTSRKFCINYALNPLFIRDCGIYSNRNLSDDEIVSMIEKIPYNYLKCELYIQQLPQKYRSAVRNYQCISLNNSFENLKNEWNENTLRNIKKAHRNGVEIIVDQDIDAVYQLFVSQKLSEIENIKKNDAVILQHIMQSALKNTDTFVVKAMSGHQILASALFMVDDQCVLFFKGASTPLGKSSGAMHLIMAKMIEKYANSHRILDFGGSNLSSVAQFYKGFGGKDITYYSWKKN